jgi:triosephosphate isomerase
MQSGAFTGDVSAAMITDCFGTFVIVGHSERRTLHGETDALVRAKAEAAHAADLEAIICIGETQAERESGATLDVLKKQLGGSVPDGAISRNTVIAYEPVWAIGTGLTPTAADVAEAHAFMRQELTARFGIHGARMRILYGGSVKPANAAELMGVANVDGALIGGASLKSADFLAICEVYKDLSS